MDRQYNSVACASNEEEAEGDEREDEFEEAEEEMGGGRRERGGGKKREGGRGRVRRRRRESQGRLEVVDDSLPNPVNKPPANHPS